jgi:hypothetical protein
MLQRNEPVRHDRRDTPGICSAFFSLTRKKFNKMQQLTIMRLHPIF